MRATIGTRFKKLRKLCKANNHKHFNIYSIASNDGIIYINDR